MAQKSSPPLRALGADVLALPVVLKSYLASREGFVSSGYLRDQAAVLGSVIRELSQSGIDPLHCPKSALEFWAHTKLTQLKPATVAAYLFAFRTFLAWARKRSPGVLNPRFDLPRAGRPFRKRFIDASTIRVLISECEDPALKFILFAGFHAGLRKAEIANAKLNWFDLDRHTVSVLRCESFNTKDGRDRDIPLTREFEAYLRVYRPAGEYMLSNGRQTEGQRYRYDFRKRYRTYMDCQAERLGLERITIHDMRRSFASVHASAGTPIYKISRWLGDCVAVVERHYAHLQAFDSEINRPFNLSA